MEDNWEKDLPREQYQSFKKVNQSQPWFEVYDIGHEIYAIYEPYQFQEVISYLIKGQNKALLWDSGNGIGDMKQCISELWDKEVIVVNSHTHFDHIGSNYQFEKVNIFNHPQAIQTMEKGISQEIYDKEYAYDTYSKKSPIDYEPMHYRRCRYQTFEEGKIFDLGNRQFEVIYTPGHSLDSIMLVNRKEKLLFTGDTYYPAPLYCFTPNTFELYVKTMNKIAKEYYDYLLITSHNEPLREGKILKEVNDFFKKIQTKEIKPSIKEDLEIYIWKEYTLMKK